MNEQLELDPMSAEETYPGERVHEQAERLAKKYPVPSVTIGQLIAAEPEQGPMVDFALNHTGTTLLARTLVPLDPSQAGCDVALMFEDGELTRPIIMGVVQEWNAAARQRLGTVEQEARVTVRHNDDSLLLTAAKEITLQCGKASITLTSAGKLLLRGAYLLSRSSGVNRIKGGSVQIN